MRHFPQPSSQDCVELLVVDESLANALYRGIPAARLLARVRLSMDRSDASLWSRSLDSLLCKGSRDHEHVTRAVARHTRVALNEGPLTADQATLAVLTWAVACDHGKLGHDASLAEIAPPSAGERTCLPETLSACALRDERLAGPKVDKRAPAFEACVRLSTRGALDAVGWARLHAVATHLERAELGARFFACSETSIFPRGVDDEISPTDRRLVVIERKPLDSLVATDPRRFGAAVWRTETTAGSTATNLAAFLADLARLLAHDGTLVAAPLPASTLGADRETTVRSPASSAPPEWNQTTAATWTDALQRGATTTTQVEAAVSRGGELALDAIGAEMLNVAAHPFASGVCAEILARSARPRDVVRLVTYFAIAPDPEPAARALGACAATELPRMLEAWFQTLLPQGAETAAGSGATGAHLVACLASLRPYPELYHVVSALLPRSSSLC
ncbi:MAG TPA: hypothetical protein VEK07_23370 [Polyangiaceae bacterium]|nr:hypothetical protein [Polyangiaceae bacterium]